MGKKYFEQENASEFITACNAAEKLDFVILDHYEFGQVWEKQVKQSISISLLSIEDMLHEQDRDILIDTLPARIEEYYKSQTPQDCVQLFGVRHALLYPEF